jgi:hypothetical protein
MDLATGSMFMTRTGFEPPMNLRIETERTAHFATKSSTWPSVGWHGLAQNCRRTFLLASPRLRADRRLE